MPASTTTSLLSSLGVALRVKPIFRQTVFQARQGGEDEQLGRIYFIFCSADRCGNLPRVVFPSADFDWRVTAYDDLRRGVGPSRMGMVWEANRRVLCNDRGSNRLSIRKRPRAFFFPMNELR